MSIPPGLEPNCGSVRPKQPMALPSCKRGSHLFFLRVRAIRVDRIHHQRALHGNEAAQAGIAALEFLHHQAVGDVGHSRAAVAFQVRAEESQFAELRHQLHGECGFAVVLFDDGKNFVVDELPRGLARQFLFVVQQGIEIDEIDAGEMRACKLPSERKYE